MRSFLTWCTVLALTVSSVAQTGAGTASKKKSSTATVSVEDFQALKEAFEIQQQQIRQLQEQVKQRDAQAAQEIQRANAAAAAAEQRAAAAEQAATAQQETVTKLQEDLTGVQNVITDNATSTQEDQKRMGAVEGFVNRFRFGGDVRVRYENFFQSTDACTPPACDPRHRARFRARFGVEGKVNEDFAGGLYLASGAWSGGNPTFSDPVSTNETFTGFFERKTIGIDRAWVTYNPSAAKWLSLTGGKFAYTWLRTPMTFDNDLNPEGFSEKFTWKTANPVVRELGVTGMQLFFNEVSKGPDSWASGAQINAKLQLGDHVTMTPAVTWLNFFREDSIVPAVVTAKSLGGNALTNAHDGVSKFMSGFFYNDYILDTQIKTPSARFPWRILLEYEKNLDAFDGNDSMYLLETSIGQTREKNDVQFGYAFGRTERDALLAVFADSDMRAATNVKQHRIFANWQAQQNTTIGWTWWRGRTIDTRLANAAVCCGVTPGEEEPELNRMQFDVVYKF